MLGGLERYRVSIADWIPSISTAAGLGFVGWLLRNWISARLTKSVGFEFDRKLELLKGELRTSEEKLRADLRARETEIATLRVGAMTALSNRQIALDKRRLDAIDQLWASVNSLSKARGISLMMSTLKFEAVAERAEKDQNMRDFLKVIGGGFDMSKDLSLGDASKARPFVSPLAWAIFTAIVAIISNGVMRWHVSQGGLGAKDFADHNALANMVKAALPEYSSYVDEHGTSVLHFLVDKLELKLLDEFRVMMSGVEADRSSVQQAAEILKYSEELAKETTVDAAQPFIAADALKRTAE
jgi:hypothetical protein